MWNSLLQRSGGPANSDSPSTRRRYERRGADLCMARLSGQSFPVRDWSLGGVQIDADSRGFQLGHMFDLTLSIRTRDRLWDITHTATVVRKNNETVALQYDPLPAHIRTQMETVQRMVKSARLSEY